MARRTSVRAHLRHDLRGGLTVVQWHQRRVKARSLVAEALNYESLVADADSEKERREFEAEVRRHLKEAVKLVGEETVDRMAINEAFDPMPED